MGVTDRLVASPPRDTAILPLPADPLNQPDPEPAGQVNPKRLHPHIIRSDRPGTSGEPPLHPTAECKS